MSDIYQYTENNFFRSILNFKKNLLKKIRIITIQKSVYRKKINIFIKPVDSLLHSESLQIVILLYEE